MLKQGSDISIPRHRYELPSIATFLKGGDTTVDLAAATNLAFGAPIAATSSGRVGCSVATASRPSARLDASRPPALLAQHGNARPQHSQGQGGAPVPIARGLRLILRAMGSALAALGRHTGGDRRGNDNSVAQSEQAEARALLSGRIG